jgi:hypothetical protein
MFVILVFAKLVLPKVVYLSMICQIQNFMLPRLLAQVLHSPQWFGNPVITIFKRPFTEHNYTSETCSRHVHYLSLYQISVVQV